MLARCSRTAVLGCLLALAPLAAQGPQRVAISGSSTLRPLLHRAQDMLARQGSGLDLEIFAPGSTLGLESLAAGHCHVAALGRDLTEGEAAAHRDLVVQRVAVDGVAIVVHGRNRVRGLTRAQVADVFLGRIRNWKDLGGADAAIEVVAQDLRRGATEVFLRGLGFEGEAVEQGLERRVRLRAKGSREPGHAVLNVGHHYDLLGHVLKRPDAIGFASSAAVTRLLADGGQVRALAIDGLIPSRANLENRTYPLRCNLNLVTRGQPTGPARELIEYLLGREGQALVENLHFVSTAKVPAAGPWR